MYGLASPSKHHILAEYGAIPIDYHTRGFAEVIRGAEPERIDFVFKGMGEETFGRSLADLRRPRIGALRCATKTGTFSSAGCQSLAIQFAAERQVD